jgi:hypothetical protein
VVDAWRGMQHNDDDDNNKKRAQKMMTMSGSGA